jgi:hypothetical protein
MRLGGGPGNSDRPPSHCVANFAPISCPYPTTIPPFDRLVGTAQQRHINDKGACSSGANRLVSVGSHLRRTDFIFGCALTLPAAPIDWAASRRRKSWLLQLETCVIRIRYRIDYVIPYERHRLRARDMHHLVQPASPGCGCAFYADSWHKCAIGGTQPARLAPRWSARPGLLLTQSLQWYITARHVARTRR